MMNHVDIEQLKKAVRDAVNNAAWMDGQCDNRLAATSQATVATAIKEIAQLGLSPEGYLRVDTRRNPEDPCRLDIGVTRNLRDFPMNAEDYKDMFGDPPNDDDLDRINCKDAGDPGHIMCGYCVWCFERRWRCSCGPC